MAKYADALKKAESAFGSKPVGGASEPCPYQETALVVLVVRQPSDEMVPDASVNVKGKSTQGKKTDGDGIAKFKPIDPDAYEIDVKLPAALEKDYEKPDIAHATVPLGEVTVAIVPIATEKTWVEFAVIDMEDNPVNGLDYRVKLPDGSVRTGFTDANGKVRIEGIKPGTCQFSLTGLDEGAWERA